AFTFKNMMLHDAPVTPSIFDWPCRCSPSLFMQLGLPSHLRFMICVNTGHQCASAAQFRSQFCLEKGTNYAAKLLIFFRKLHCRYAAFGMKIALGLVNSRSPGKPFS